MARNPTPKTSEFPFHVVARSNNHDWFQLPLVVVWEICAKNLTKVEADFGFKTHAFVLMSNHYHWLVTTPNANLGEGMCRFQTEVSQTMARSTNRKNHIFGGRYKSSVIATSAYYANVYRYIYQNPLRANIVEGVEHYPWSTLVSGPPLTHCAPGFDQDLPQSNLIDWLNQRPQLQADELIRKGLRRSQFKFPREPNSKLRYTGIEFL